MKKKIKNNIPNMITISRLFSLVIGFILIINNNYTIGLILYIYGAVSDALDGYFARRLNAYSKFGKYLDAISDKLYILSIIIIAFIYNNYLVIIPLVLELIISIINYLNIKRNKKVYTERVGKIKMTILSVMLITLLLMLKYKILFYLFITLYILTIYFEVQSIIAYINQLNNKTKEEIVTYKEKNIIKKIKLLLDEFIKYLIHPVKIIK